MAEQLIKAGEVPAMIWPSDNTLGIPSLDPSMQAAEIVPPFLTWGSVSRNTPNPGTWGFYTEDYRYTALWNDPKPIVNSGCTVAVEPNFSCYEDTPAWVAHHRIGQKRWLARWWQECGIRIFVDLNVAPRYAKANLLGVPKGWRAYCTRGYLSRLHQLEAEYEIACNRAGTDKILFLVYGGSEKLRSFCESRGWAWIREQREVAKRRLRAYGQV